jgi:hypothetical protein
LASDQGSHTFNVKDGGKSYPCGVTKCSDHG